jgi:hypothetical protein
MSAQRPGSRRPGRPAVGAPGRGRSPDNVSRGRLAPITRHVGVPRHLYRREPASLTVRSVCTRCNNACMSRLEDEAKQLLVPMLQGVCEPAELARPSTGLLRASLRWNPGRVRAPRPAGRECSDLPSAGGEHRKPTGTPTTPSSDPMASGRCITSTWWSTSRVDRQRERSSRECPTLGISGRAVRCSMRPRQAPSPVAARVCSERS